MTIITNDVVDQFRYCARVEFDLIRDFRVCGCIKINMQLSVLYLAFLFMITSRILLVALFYNFTKAMEPHWSLKVTSSGPNILTPLCVEVHHLIIFTLYLINQRLTEADKSLAIIEKLGRWNMVISFLLSSFSEVFLILLHFPKRYRRAIRTHNKEKDKGDDRFLSFYLIYSVNLAEFLLFGFLLHSYSGDLEKSRPLTGRDMLNITWGGVGGYVLSGLFFGLYHSPLLHPDKLKQRTGYKVASSTRLWGMEQMCGKRWTAGPGTSV